MKKLDKLISDMECLGYEYDGDVVTILFTNVEDGSDLTFGNWDDVEAYVKDRMPF